MKFDPDRFLNQLVVLALTVFIVASLLLAAVLVREIWLQQRIAGLSSDVETNLEDLEQMTEQIQDQLSDMRETPATSQNQESGEEVAGLLEDVDQQLEEIGGNLDEVRSVLEPEAVEPAIAPEDTAESAATQDRADQVFTIFAVLIGITAIAIALLLGMALSVEERSAAGGRSVLR